MDLGDRFTYYCILDEAGWRKVESLNQRIVEYDRRIEQIATEAHPEVALLKQLKGVGTLIALTMC